MTQNMEYSKASVTTSVIHDDNSDSSCPRCHGMVFDAEKMAMRSGVYHKKCFTCTTCKRALDYLLAVDGPNAEQVYCHSCYSKNFGPTKMRCSALGDTFIKPNQPGETGCPRCGGAVFHAEEVCFEITLILPALVRTYNNGGLSFALLLPGSLTEILQTYT
jgi:hypothetical protein